MDPADRTLTTRLLRSVTAGEAAAADELLPVVYDELRRIASRLMGGQRSGHTMQPTELIHEAYLRLIDDGDDEPDAGGDASDRGDADASDADASDDGHGGGGNGGGGNGGGGNGGGGNGGGSDGGGSGKKKRLAWEGRLHFTRVAARAMRFVLVDHARAKLSKKRGGGRQRVTLDTRVSAIADNAEQVLFVNDGLERLAGIDEQLAKIVELRFFGGMTMDEIARALGSSTRTVERGWRLARAWWIKEFGEG